MNYITIVCATLLSSAFAGWSIFIFGYQQKAEKKQEVSVWLDRKTLPHLFRTTPIDITISTGSFDTPVWVDLLTGHVYEIPKKQWPKAGSTYKFSSISADDSPVLIAQKSSINF